MHNNLVRHVIDSMSTLGVYDQKVIGYLISKGIKNHKNAEMPVEIEGSVTELGKIMNYKGHALYEFVREATESLMRHTIRFKDPESGADVSCSWLAWGKYWEGQGKFVVEFPKPLRPMLTELGNQRTEIELEKMLGLGGGNYAIRLYQMCKSWQSNRGFTCKIDKLRQQLGVPNDAYKRISDFKSRVLNYPLQTINKRSDICVEYEKHNHGRSWTHLVFYIKPHDVDKNNTRLPKKVRQVPEHEKRVNEMIHGGHPERRQVWDAGVRLGIVSGEYNRDGSPDMRPLMKQSDRVWTELCQQELPFKS